MYRRNIARIVLEALADTPVVVLNGPRQSGKSTLARQLLASVPGAVYATLDDPAELALAQNDPLGFIARFGDHPGVIDEIQRAPELSLPIKLSVDRDRRPGRFIVTGSADVLALPRLGDSLAGRVEYHTLWPLSQGELSGVVEGFIPAVFGDDTFPKLPSVRPRSATIAEAATGGFPAARERKPGDRRDSWFEGFEASVLSRDVRDLSNIESQTALPRLLRLLAARTSSLVNLADVSRTLDVPYATLRRYFALLELVFLVRPVPPWWDHSSGPLLKSPRLAVCDSGLLAYLLRLDPGRTAFMPELAGQLIETFVTAELRKQCGWSAERVQMFFFRTRGGAEVDLVLEDRAGRIVGVEVKAGSTPQAKDFRGLRALGAAAGDRFVRGVVLHLGEQTLPFGDRLWAMPVDALWQLGATPQPTSNEPPTLLSRL
ncbi:MAG: ATP-binding protein [Tepidiformaceae bacterium]